MRVKSGLAEMLKGGVIMDVTDADQARIAEEAGAVAVMALERVPADIRAAGGVARMSDPSMIEGIMDAVSIPVMAKARIGHFVEAQVLEALGVDYIDESEVLTPADDEHHVDKNAFRAPFVCGARDLGEALRRIGEGAAMIRTKGEAGSGNIVEAVRHLRRIGREIRALVQAPRDEWMARAGSTARPMSGWCAWPGGGKLRPELRAGRMPPRPTPLCMSLGAEAVFVGRGSESSDPRRGRAQSCAPRLTGRAEEVDASLRGLGAAMPGRPWRRSGE